MPTMQQFAEATRFYKRGLKNIEYAKNCLKMENRAKIKKDKDFYKFHFLSHIDLVLFWAKEIKDELG